MGIVTPVSIPQGPQIGGTRRVRIFEGDGLVTERRETFYPGCGWIIGPERQLPPGPGVIGPERQIGTGLFRRVIGSLVETLVEDYLNTSIYHGKLPRADYIPKHPE